MPDETPPRLFDPALPPSGRDVVAVARNARDTSRAAAERALPRSGTKRERVLDLLAARPRTDDEIEVATGWSHQTASASRRGLVVDGWVEDSGDRRTIRSGNEGIVWTLTAAARRARTERNRP